MGSECRPGDRPWAGRCAVVGLPHRERRFVSCTAEITTAIGIAPARRARRVLTGPRSRPTRWCAGEPRDGPGSAGNVRQDRRLPAGRVYRPGRRGVWSTSPETSAWTVRWRSRSLRRSWRATPPSGSGSFVSHGRLPRVGDPHIIPVYEAGEASGIVYLAMRYVQGGDARSLLSRLGPLPFCLGLDHHCPGRVGTGCRSRPRPDPPRRQARQHACSIPAARRAGERPAGPAAATSATCTCPISG